MSSMIEQELVTAAPHLKKTKRMSVEQHRIELIMYAARDMSDKEFNRLSEQAQEFIDKCVILHNMKADAAENGNDDGEVLVFPAFPDHIPDGVLAVSKPDKGTKAKKKKSNPRTNGDPGRKTNGQFAKGNGIGNGNKSRTNEPAKRLKQALIGVITEEDIKEIAQALMKKAKAGDEKAANTLFDRIYIFMRNNLANVKWEKNSNGN